jgi:hypothetical protein
MKLKDSSKTNNNWSEYQKKSTIVRSREKYVQEFKYNVHGRQDNVYKIIKDLNKTK